MEAKGNFFFFKQLQSLAPLKRKVYSQQKFYFNLSSREIAKKLSMSPTAVRMRCSRAIKKLKEILSAEGFALKED